MNILITTATFSIDVFPSGLRAVYNPFERKLTEEEITALMEQYQPVGMVAGVEPLTRRVLERAKNLKIISRCGVGLDSVDLEAAAELGIRVLNTPGAPTASVAELTVGLILCLARRINTNDANMRNGLFSGPTGCMVKDKTVGIIGCGRIGTRVAKLLEAFECRLVGYDPQIAEHDLCRMVSLEELIGISDIISLHNPYSKANHHMIGEREFDRMKKTALLVNVSRGGLVDEAALYQALAEGKIAGAALDCFENEPYDGPLTKLENTVFSPHVGSAALEGRLLMEKQALDNLLKGMAGLKLTE